MKGTGKIWLFSSGSEIKPLIQHLIGSNLSVRTCERKAVAPSNRGQVSSGGYGAEPLTVHYYNQQVRIIHRRLISLLESVKLHCTEIILSWFNLIAHSLLFSVVFSQYTVDSF